MIHSFTMYKLDLFFWWSIISTVLGLLFLLGNVAQYVAEKKEKTIHKSQVKIWQHHANGINHGLTIATIQGKYSTVDDVLQAIRVIQPSVYSLYTSLNEERLFSETEIKQKQLEQERQNRELMESFRRQTQSNQTTLNSPKVPQTA